MSHVGEKKFWAKMHIPINMALNVCSKIHMGFRTHEIFMPPHNLPLVFFSPLSTSDHK
jgi:hypothetical protein